MNNNNNCCILGIVLIVILIIGCTSLIYYKMPKRYCHDEINMEKYVINKWDYSREYDYSSEIVCENGVEVGYYKYSNKKVIYTYSHSDGKICLIKNIKEICVVK